MGNLPFERTRYNPVRDVTSDEAERNKREEAQQEAAIRDPSVDQKDVPPAKPGKATG